MPQLRKYLPSNNNVFAIWLVLQPFQSRQMNLGFSLAVELHLIREQANFFCNLINGLGYVRLRYFNIT